jgi:hypothetical protein
MRKGGFSTNDVKEVFRLYNWQKTEYEQDPEVLNRIEELLRLQDAPWNGPKTRAGILTDKVYAILVEEMRRHGWAEGSSYREEDTGKIRMYFSPANPKKKKNVGSQPKWLPWDLLNLERDPLWNFKHIRLENNQGEAIQSGSGLYQIAEDIVTKGQLVLLSATTHPTSVTYSSRAM